MSSVLDAEGRKHEIDWNDPFQRVKYFYEYSSPNGNECIDALWLGNLKLVSVAVDPAEPSVARTIFEFVVKPNISNAGGNLHGGAAAVIFDVTTTMTCSAVSKEDFWDATHVSRALNCQYIRPAPTGTILLVESEIVHLGRSMGQLRATMRRKDNGKVCYTCVHDKIQVPNSRL